MSVEVVKYGPVYIQKNLMSDNKLYVSKGTGYDDIKAEVLTYSDLKDWLLCSEFEKFKSEKYNPLSSTVDQIIKGLRNCALKTEVTSVEKNLAATKKQIIEIINLCQQQGKFIQQFGDMIEAVDSLMKQQEELASLGEAQHALIKQRAEAISALYEKMLKLNEKLTATCVAEIENFQKKSEEIKAELQEESTRCIDDFLTSKKQEFLSETSRSFADIATAEKNSFSCNIQQTTQQNIQKMQADIDDYFNKKKEEFNSRYDSLLYEKMLELNEKLTATCVAEIENFQKKSEEIKAELQEESTRCIDDFLTSKKQEFLSETSRSFADIATAEKNSFSCNIQQTTQQNIQKMQANIDDYFNKKKEEFNSRYDSFGKRLRWLFTGK